MKTKTELTTNDKLMVIFDKLLVYLSPKETKKDKISSYKYSGYNMKKQYHTYITAECNFLNVKNMPDLFPNEFAVEIKEDNILIMGENMEMNFAPDQILTIYNRIKKTLKN